MTQLLIDGDLLLYRAASASEHVHDFGNDVWFLTANFEHTKEAFQTSLNSITSNLGSDDFLMCLSDRENFRVDLTDTYKSSRKATRKPVTFVPLREWVIDNFPTVIRPKLEADDCLGILATVESDKKRIMVSEDKDLQTIPGLLYRQGELVEITKEQADRFWLYQTLTGDPTDGYKGCPGIGAVKADKILGDRPSWDNVVQAYLKAGLTRDDAILNARLARILRAENWDKDKQEVILWKP